MRALDIAICADGDKLLINAPKGALTGELRAAIAAGKAELLAMLRAGAAIAVRSIAHRGMGDGAPLSLAQERLWFLAQLSPESSVYNLCRGFRLRGPLHRQGLAASLDEIVRRHEALRSKFCTIDGRPLQVPVACAGRLLRVTDLRRLSGTGLENHLRRRITREAETPFDLASGRLLRARLLQVDDAEHVLLLTTHHLVADAWSMGILVGELWQLYRAFAAGQASPLVELPIQYGDFASWQRRRLETAPLQEQLRYWRKQLDGAAAVDLPTDRPRPVRQSFRGGRYPLYISPSLTASLNRLAAQENATPFMALLAAFQLLLHRYSGQDDIAVGSAVTDRPRVECEGLIGFFVNTLVLRGDLSGQPCFRDFLRRVREVCLDAYAHQDIPFEKLVEDLKPRRELDRQPLFQVFFVLQNTLNRWAVPDGIDVEPLEVENTTAHYDLSLYLRERGGRLLGYFEYASDLFDAATIERMAGHFSVLLDDIVTNPDRAIGALEMLGASERRRMLVEWNDSAAAYPSQSCIHELFEAQVARTPDAVAIEFQSSTLTFAELNRRANRVAHFLRGRGVGADMPVGLLVARSLEMVVGLLGILKAGAAYVPLDPSYPPARLDFMVADAEIKLLLTQRKVAGTISPAKVTLVCLDDADLFAGQSHENPAGLASAASAAYVIYTSGSTGLPKGVVGLHRGAVNRCAWMWQRYPFRSGEVCCSKTSLSFVDSVWEIFGPLLQGVLLAIADDDTSHDPHLLIEFLAHRRVSRIVLVPSLLRSVLDDGADLAVKLPWLKLWTSSGEALTIELAQRFRKNHPEAVLLNLYGSSEVAADASFYEYDGGALGETVAIGRPISNSTVYLLDARRHPVPVGVTGELYVGGDGLARGYWRRPELTAEKFVVNPFSADPGSRLFRTGDLARYRADGNLEYLGRADNQVKLAGQRVELREIETALRSHPRIEDCVVNLPDHGHGAIGNATLAKSLVACIVSPAPPTGRELRDYLQQMLPAYMIPAAFVRLQRIPLLPNGKIDRRALPELTGLPAAAELKFLGPRSEAEERVTAIWREGLGVDRIGVDDDFFELGGHSILAMQIVARLRAAFASEFSLREFFNAPTIAGVAARICTRERAAPPLVLPASKPGAAPVTSTQELFWRMDSLLSGADFLNLPYGYRLSGLLNQTALRRAIETIMARQAVLRTVFKERHGQLVQVVRRRMRVPLKRFDLAVQPEPRVHAELERISRDDAQEIFDLAQGPPFRLKLVRLAEAEHILLVTMHHIIADHWSMRLFRNELAAFYKAFALGEPVAVAELPYQFIDFSRWQRQMMDTGRFNDQLNYWQKQLAGPLPRIDFPAVGKRRKKLTLRSGRLSLDMSAAVLGAIHILARRQKTTPFVVLVAALNLWLYRLTGCRDLCVGTLVANRQQLQTENLIGYFVNAVVLRTRVAPRMSFENLLQQTRSVAQEAFAHQDLPIADLGRNLPGEEGEVIPLYQVMVNYRRLVEETAEAAGLRFAPWSKDRDRAADPEVALTSAELSFEFRELATKLTATVDYRCSLFGKRDAQHLLDGFMAVLVAATGRPEGDIANFQIVSDGLQSRRLQ